MDPDGSPVPSARVIRNVVEQAVLADGLGIDVIGLGETIVTTSPSPPRDRAGRRSPHARNGST
ncbi:MAG: LLM class flavin-dependent oxidoreductase [Microthrixaceae bacterium]|nr:LLM class flavin-dependent oxidoreductase [Microthrixaceae bacterium]